MLSEEEIKRAMEQMVVTQVTSRKPFTVSWDFLDPTSNLCFLRFWWGTNPFKDFDFTDPIPNPQVRRAAASNVGYGEKKDRVWNGAAQERWATVDKDSQHYW